ncbi:MAG: ABC transporter ATP-binding protein [Acidobacteria bacterium]|nr:ABC transporter ATP-binding protein [Acidobacteriota bacterium]
MMAYALELQNVVKRFGPTTAVDDLTLRIGSGAFVGLLGRNGAGKSTTINMCTGMLKPSAGSIRVLTMDMKSDALAVKRRIGVMAQDEGFLDCLTGAQYLHFTGRVYGLDDNRIAERSAELLETLDLAPAPGALIREYSYGMKKKLALCAALIHGPEMLFLDEPFEGIDPVTGRTIKDILLGLHRKGITVLMSSHILDVVEKLCPQIAIIDRGRLRGFGTMEEIRQIHGSNASLEQLFIELMGGAKRGELSWL